MSYMTNKMEVKLFFSRFPLLAVTLKHIVEFQLLSYKNMLKIRYLGVLQLAKNFPTIFPRNANNKICAFSIHFSPIYALYFKTLRKDSTSFQCRPV